MILYLHGLNSSGASLKAAQLRAALEPIEVLSPSYPAHRPRPAVQALTAFLQRRLHEHPRAEPWLWVGSSMGGFYGRYLAQRFAVRHLVLINPALRPWELLAAYRGETFTTASGERYLVDTALIEATRLYAVDDSAPEPPTTLFLDQGDEVIDWRIAEAIYRRRARVLSFPGGDHAFAHLDRALPLIRDTYRALG
jgi:predicted esterase YcpF (UPF0227 family)